MCEPMRVAQILNRMDSGGIEAVVMNYYRHIDRTKVQFDFYFAQGSTFPQRDELERLGAGIYPIPPYTQVIAYHKALYKAFKERRYQIVHAHLSTMSVFPLFAAWRAGVPVRICHNHSTAHWGEGKKTLLKYLLRPFAKVFATDYFACGEIAGRWMYGDQCFNKGNVYVMQNAIDTQKFVYDPEARAYLRSEFKIPQNDFVVGHVGRFMYQKNHQFLLEVFAELCKEKKNAWLLLVGEGELERETRQKVHVLGIEEKTVFAGVRKDVNKLYSAMDVFCLPSFYEGVPVVLMEAQANGLPCIFSTEVPKEACRAGNSSQISLQEDISAWMERLLLARREKESKVPDIHRVAAEIERFYKTKEEKMNQLISETESRKWVKGLLFVQLVLLYLPSLQLFYISTDNGSIPASLCYFFSLIFIPLLLRNWKALRLPSWYITTLWGYVVILAAIRIPVYGLSKSILHWLFGFYLLIVLLNVGKRLETEDWNDILEYGAIAFALLHLAYMMMNYRTVLELWNGYFFGTMEGTYGAILPSLTRGGRNLDATWLGLGAFFVRGKKKAVYSTYAIVFAFLGSSRVGVIAVGIAALWTLIWDNTYRLTKKRLKWYALYAACLLTFLVCTGLATAFLTRFISGLQAPGELLGLNRPESAVEIEILSNEAILSGRKPIWSRVPQMFKDNPFGYGVGNAMRVMRTNYGFTSHEDVVHNVFLQWLLDEGFIGGAAYIGLVGGLFVSQLKRKSRAFQDPFAAYFLSYVVLSLVQFHGGEALMIYVLGAYLTGKHQFMKFPLPRRWRAHCEE